MYRNFGMFSWVIQNLLKKDLTLSGRSGIWDAIVVAIARKPLFGYGNLEGTSIVTITNDRYGVNAHNMYLWCLFRGGIFNLASLLILLGLTIKGLSNKLQTYVVSYLSWALFCLMIYWLVEALSIIFMIPIIYFSISCDRFDVQIVNKKRTKQRAFVAKTE